MQQQIKLKAEPSALFQTLFGFALVSMVMLGIGGTIYKVVSHDGWLARWLGHGLPGGTAAFGTLVVLGVLAWFSRLWTTHRTQGLLADLIVYAFALTGVVYALRFWSVGAL
jgi:hypothetical protein